mgnify:CR=1 FL=1
MADAYKELVDWAGGVVSSMPPDHIPDNAIPQGINTAFVNVGGNRTGIGTPPGLRTVNTTALGAASVHWQHVYSYNTGAGYANYLATVTTDGKLYYKKSDDAYTAALAVPTNFPYPPTVCFDAGTSPVDGAVFNNRLFLVNADGERRSLIDQSYVPWGLSPINTWTSAHTGGGAMSMPNGTYEVCITSYNATSGAESSASNTESQTVTTNDRIYLTINPTAAESAQYSHWRIYLRRTSTQSQYYLVTTLKTSAGATITTDGNIPLGSTTAYIDLSADQIAALTTVGPSTTENDGPPAEIQHVVSFGRRLIVCDGRNIYWSKEDKGDNFPATFFEPIDTGEGDELRGMHPYSDDVLLLFLSTAIWGVFGNDPQTWTIKPIDLTVGLTSHNSIVAFNNKVGWWDAANGPVYYDGAQLTKIGIQELGAAAVTTGVNLARSQAITAGYDQSANRVIWATSSTNSSVNDRLFVYNTQLNRFEASYWDGMDAASLCHGTASDGTTRLFLGNETGQVFYFDKNTRNNGVPGGTTTGTFLPTQTSVSTLSGTGFYTTGSGLLGRKVVIVDANHQPVAKRRITGNTSTTLTLESAVTGLQLSTTYTYYIGSPDFRLYGKWIDHDQPFLRKRFDWLYLHFGSETSVADTYISTQLEFNTSSQETVTGSDVISGSLWNLAKWNLSKWGVGTTLKKRIPVMRSGTACRPVIYCFSPGRDIIIYKIALLSRLLSDRYYG